MCPSGATCLSAGYCFSGLALYKSRGVGLVQSGRRRYLIEVLFLPRVNLKIVHLAFNNNSLEHRGDHIWCSLKTVDRIRFKLFFRHRCFVDLHKYPILFRRQYASWLPSYMHIWYIVVTFVYTKVVIHVARCAWYNIYMSRKTDTTIQRYIFWLKWHFAFIPAHWLFIKDYISIDLNMYAFNSMHRLQLCIIG